MLKSPLGSALLLGLGLAASSVAIFVLVWSSRKESTAENTNLRRRLGLIDPHTIEIKGEGGLLCPASRMLRVDASTTLPSFIESVLHALNQASIDDRPISFLPAHYDSYASVPGGFWVEFGVFQGKTLEGAHANLSQQQKFTGTIAGFDSFEGLPEDWIKGWIKGFKAGHFGEQKDLFTMVRKRLSDEIELHKGWFQDTIPAFLTAHPEEPAAVVHLDGDLFVSATIPLSTLDERIVPGTHLIFDELILFPGYQKHEIMSLWLWMKQRRGVTLCAMGHKGKIDISPETFDPKDYSYPEMQSAWFQVIS
ncbi:hypothetical protein THAOC_19299 [Thalassiosira oceanica]|uniref:Uncharacterized protein n=1 Tax=Thalassiosira oceanica TaxID=159749 RepID=K0S519_THAOC|nr:hypothetical protein THAOC_19299 [Thalassiosira oceanica]|eukprot:EJK60360.1 hypothetical protein THAOC_19299 [Thalassiosira oceanica]